MTVEHEEIVRSVKSIADQAQDQADKWVETLGSLQAMRTASTVLDVQVGDEVRFTAGDWTLVDWVQVSPTYGDHLDNILIRCGDWDPPRWFPGDEQVDIRRPETTKREAA
jgi:hypothetical protein